MPKYGVPECDDLNALELGIPFTNANRNHCRYDL